jgi:hypothetical protein
MIVSCAVARDFWPCLLLHPGLMFRFLRLVRGGSRGGLACHCSHSDRHDMPFCLYQGPFWCVCVLIICGCPHSRLWGAQQVDWAPCVRYHACDACYLLLLLALLPLTHHQTNINWDAMAHLPLDDHHRRRHMQQAIETRSTRCYKPHYCDLPYLWMAGHSTTYLEP